MSYEGCDGMKLRDLAKTSGDPESVMSALHLFRPRFWNRGKCKRSHESYKSVPRSPSTPLLLTLLQQRTVVPALRILRRPRHPGPLVTFHIRTHHRDQNPRPRTSHRHASFLDSLTFEQNQSGVYHEVLMAADLSEEDAYQLDAINILGSSALGTAEFIYGNDTVYFAQPGLSQFVPGGHGSGTFSPASILLKDSPNNTLVSTGGNAPKTDIGMVLRCIPPALWRRGSTP